MLGKTGLRVSVVGLETHQWSGMGGRFFTVEDIRAILARARTAGINFIDTGECYFFHSAERLIGEALGKERGKWIIATKFGHISKPKEIIAAWSADDIQKQLDDSLRALTADYIDLYQVHINSKEDMRHIHTNMSALQSILGEAKKAGKIRAVGAVLGDDELFGADGKLLSLLIKKVGIETVQVVYNRVSREAERRIFPLAKKHGLGVIARVPLAKGYLSSRFKPTNKSYDAARMAVVEKIKKEEVPAGVDIAELAIRWCTKNPIVSSVVPGHSASEQIDSTVRASRLAL